MDTATLTERIHHERTAALVVNARSRSGERLFRRTCEALQRHGYRLVATSPVHDPRLLRDAVRAAREHGSRLIVVGGGDGTISAAVNELAGRDLALGLIPLGTENSAARTLGIPLTVDGAVEVIADGAVTAIDLGRIGQDYFVNLVSAGVSAETARTTSPRLKRMLGKLGFLLNGLGIFAMHRPFHCRLETDDRHIEAMVHEVIIANGRHFGDTVLAQEASIRDCVLLVHTVDAMKLRQMAWRLLSFMLFRRPGLPGVHHFTASRIYIDADPPQQLDVDGELTVLTPAVISVAPRTLNVMVPRSSSLL